MLYKIWLVAIGAGSLSAVLAAVSIGMFMRNPYTYVWQQSAYENAWVRNFWFTALASAALWLSAWVIWP